MTLQKALLTKGTHQILVVAECHAQAHAGRCHACIHCVAAYLTPTHASHEAAWAPLHLHDRMDISLHTFDISDFDTHCRQKTSHKSHPEGQTEAGAKSLTEQRSSTSPSAHSQTQEGPPSAVSPIEDLLQQAIDACIQSGKLPPCSSVQVSALNMLNGGMHLWSACRRC